MSEVTPPVVETPPVAPPPAEAPKETPAVTPPPTEGTKDAETKVEATTETKTEEKVVPEKYVLTPKDIALSKHDLEYIETFAREQKMSQDEAQALVDQQTDFVKRQLKAQDETLTAKLQADPELGGDKMTQTLQNTKRALEKIDKDGKLAATLDRYGISKDPEIVRALNYIGSNLKDDKLIPSHGGTGGVLNKAKALYGETMSG